jgi:hypothetical protein
MIVTANPRRASLKTPYLLACLLILKPLRGPQTIPTFLLSPALLLLQPLIAREQSFALVAAAAEKFSSSQQSKVFLLPERASERSCLVTREKFHKFN